MPYTVPVAFDSFITKIGLTGDHEETAEVRRKRLVSLLGKDLTILDSFPTGSIPRQTALRSSSDLDIMVVLHYGKHVKGKLPSQVLGAVQKSLSEYRTNVRRNGQAVTLHYKSWPDVDIVPVSRSVNDDGKVTHYNVPNMNNESWVESRPRRHSANMVAKAHTCGAEFYGLMQMMKWWSQKHSDFLTSYHIEAIGLKASLPNPIDDYSWAVFQFFDQAVEITQTSLWYEGAYADSYLDYNSRNEIVKRLEKARDKSRDAWYQTYDQNKNHKKAIEIWQQVFVDGFPPYGS